MAKPGHGFARLPEHDARWGDFIPKKRSSHHDTARKMAETTLSLASGTFCAACQALFLFAVAISAACRTPERRTAKMKISYIFANGENSEAEVNEEIGTFILDSRREEDNLGRKERYHCYSMDVVKYEGVEYADDVTPERVLMLEESNGELQEALESLTEVQRERVGRLADGLSINEIARREGVAPNAVMKTAALRKWEVMGMEHTLRLSVSKELASGGIVSCRFF